MACNTEGQYDRRLLQYKKITGLDEITNTIRDLYDIDMDTDPVPVGEFEKVIDLNHAHMCLEAHMHNAEHRFAYVVTHTLNKGVSLEEISKVVEDAGEKHKINHMSIEDTFNALMNRILDGMPCDETIQLTSHNDKNISWEIIEDMHSSFWNEVGGNSNYYYELLQSYVSGILKDTEYLLEIIGNQFFTLRLK